MKKLLSFYFLFLSFFIAHAQKETTVKIKVY